MIVRKDFLSFIPTYCVGDGMASQKLKSLTLVRLRFSYFILLGFAFKCNAEKMRLFFSNLFDFAEGCKIFDQVK